MKPYLVGINGGTASGKTYVLNELRKAFGPEALTVISMDNYYKDFADQVVEPDTGMVNYDEPDSMMLDLFLAHIRQLVAGQTVQVREYTFNVPRAPRMLTYPPAPIIVVEGVFVFWLKPLRELLDLKLYLEAEEHVKLARRIRRDTVERQLTIDYILDQYLYQVIPAHRKYIEPYKFDADLILPNNQYVNKAVQVVVDHLRQQLAARA